MSRGSGAVRKAAPAPRRPRHRVRPHHWHAGDVPGLCAHCPLPRRNPVHDEAAIAAAEAELAERQAEHARRTGDR